MINQPEGAEYWRGGLVVTIEMHLSLTSITSADKINIKYFDETNIFLTKKMKGEIF